MVGIVHDHPQIGPTAQPLKDVQRGSVLDVPGGSGVAQTVPGETHITRSVLPKFSDTRTQTSCLEGCFDFLDRPATVRKDELRVLTDFGLQYIHRSF